MIAIINPPNPPGMVSNKDMMGGFGQSYPQGYDIKVPPLDLPYIAAVLRNSKIEFKIFDCLGSEFSLERLIQELKKSRIEQVFMRTSISTFNWDTEVAERIKQDLRATIVFFGPYVTTQSEDIINNPSVDGIVLGDPEYAIRDVILHGFKNNRGGVWYKEEGRVVKNKSRALIPNLDELPFPAWDLLPYMQYNIGELMPKSRPTLFLQTSRGCPFGCGYCPYPVAQGTNYRKRSSQNVLDEIDYLVKNFDVKNIVIRDAEFTLDRKRAEEICRGMIRSKHGISWRCETRIDTLDEALIELMHDAGCMGINMGIESKSESVCKQVGRKPLEASSTKKVIKKCRELGIHTFCFYIIGLPGDDLSSVVDTIEYAIELNADISQFTAVTPYPGTSLYRWAMDNKYIESFDHNSFTGYEAVMRNESLTAEQISWLRSGAQLAVNLLQRDGFTDEKCKLNGDRKLIVALLYNLSLLENNVSLLGNNVSLLENNVSLLERRLTEKDREMSEQRREILNSYSWKITAPLRAIIKVLFSK